MVSLAHDIKEAWLRDVGDCFLYHVVALVSSEESHILHSLHEGHSATVYHSCSLLQVNLLLVNVVNVVARPEAHAEHECDEELRPSSINKGILIEKLGATLLRRISVLEHGRVTFKVLEASLGACATKETHSSRSEYFL